MRVSARWRKFFREAKLLRILLQHNARLPSRLQRQHHVLVEGQFVILFHSLLWKGVQ